MLQYRALLTWSIAVTVTPGSPGQTITVGPASPGHGGGEVILASPPLTHWIVTCGRYGVAVCDTAQAVASIFGFPHGHRKGYVDHASARKGLDRFLLAWGPVWRANLLRQLHEVEALINDVATQHGEAMTHAVETAQPGPTPAAPSIPIIVPFVPGMTD
ncbi:hypothetical protein DENSPDRAFT_887214 [Dentipellis sp. KUC8613]|nr:hypothetical protein DENSPDRAFT_887214 [Dentipellis sp. KUC8613]